MLYFGHRPRTRMSLFLVASIAPFVWGYSSAAQTASPTSQEKEVERLEAEAELERARADRDKAAAERIQALGLPSFTGETKLEQGAGAMEATMLATHALLEAADQISKDIAAKPDGTRKVLLLRGDEVIDFAEAAMIETELSAIERAFAEAGIKKAEAADQGYKFFGIDPGTLVAAASALAGLLRSETSVSPVEIASLSDRVLINAVAGRLGSRAILPGALVGPTGNESPLISRLNEVGAIRELANVRRTELAKQAKKNEAAIARLTGMIGRFDTLFGRISTADNKGVVPIVRAARLDAMLKQNPAVLRIFVDKVGGSLINSKNIATTFGADPIKVSGGLIASYTLTDPASGGVWASDLLVCRTTLSRLRPIHEAEWQGKTGRKAEGTNATCRKLGPDVI